MTTAGTTAPTGHVLRTPALQAALARLVAMVVRRVVIATVVRAGISAVMATVVMAPRLVVMAVAVRAGISVAMAVHRVVMGTAAKAATRGAMTVALTGVMAAAVSPSAVVPAVSDRTVSPTTARVTMTRSCPKKSQPRTCRTPHATN